MVQPNFASIMDEAPTEVVVPTPIPVGTYVFTVTGQPRYDKSIKKGTKYVEFTLKPIAAEDDVDLEALEKADGFENKTFRLTFYETEDAIYRLDEFHEHCGIDLSQPMSRRLRNDEVINRQVRGYVKHEPNQSGDRIYANIARTLAAE